MVSQLEFQKGKDAEVAWVDAQIVLKEGQIDAKPIADEDEPMEIEDGDSKILTLEPIISGVAPPHETVFINDIKLLDLKQVLAKHNINSEWANGVLWSCNNTIAIRKVILITLEGSLLFNYAYF